MTDFTNDTNEQGYWDALMSGEDSALTEGEINPINEIEKPPFAAGAEIFLPGEGEQPYEGCAMPNNSVIALKAQEESAYVNSFFDRIKEFSPRYSLKYGVSANGDGTFRCNCGRESCTGNNRGKHPISDSAGHAVFVASLDEALTHTERGGNLGIVPNNGLFVLDIDDPTTSFDWVCDRLAECGIDADTFTAESARGKHMYFRRDTGTTPASKDKIFDKKIEIIGANKPINCPPSRHYTGIFYRIASDAPIVTVDSAQYNMLLNHLQPPKRENYAPPKDFSKHDKAPLTEAEIEKMLQYISADCSHEQWVKIGMSIYHGTDGKGYDLFDSWSATGSEYPGTRDTRIKWNSFRGVNAVTVGTVIDLAVKGGYRSERKEREKPSRPAVSVTYKNQTVAVNAPAELDADEWEENGSRDDSVPEEKASKRLMKAYRFNDMRNDPTPTPPDLVEGRIAIPGGFTLLAGPPKVGKSDFLLELLCCMACGRPFLGFDIPRPLRVFYLQSEVKYHYIKERVQWLKFSLEELDLIGQNLVLTEQTHLTLNDAGAAEIIETVWEFFKETPPDVICFDPLRNIFHAERGATENDNTAMVTFLKSICAIRDEINPAACAFLVHHTRKPTDSDLKGDIFSTISGAGAIRGFYDTGLLICREKEGKTARRLNFDIRNGPGINPIGVDKEGGKWVVLPENQSERLVGASIGERFDAERMRKKDVILQIIADEAMKGNLYPPTAFAEAFEGKSGLGSRAGIAERLRTLITAGYIKFNSEIGAKFKRGRIGQGMMTVYEMLYKPAPEEEAITLLPTHYRHTDSRILPVENPQLWHLQDGTDIASETHRINQEFIQTAPD